MMEFKRTGANQNIDSEYVKMVGGLCDDWKEMVMVEKPDFAFEKKIAICESVYVNENRLIVLDAFQKLFQCVKETNELHNVSCEFFRLDFRPQTLQEEISQAFPRDMTVLDLKWGSKRELEKVKE